MYLSYDSGKLTSTLVNLDIEEMCFCLACAIIKHIEYFSKQRANTSILTRSTVSDSDEL